ncbi:hypothetical protein AB0M35_24025 [Micromonospora sp. NPDC051196]|uniref:hypothetical protein n=1 Tax=Micromonospora sp. NPDC051196 TaxID=3155281 RepID=UPI0034288899
MANPRPGGHHQGLRRVFRVPGRPAGEGSGKPYLKAVVSGACMVLVLAACATDGAARHDRQESSPAPTAVPAPTSTVGSGDVSPHPYVGMWVTADGHIRHRNARGECPL